MPNDQDRLFKELIAKTLPELLPLKSELTPIPNSTLSPEFAGTFQRHADYLCKAVDSEGNEWVLHFEFQSRRDADMVYRMREYHFYISQEYNLPVFPIVILASSEGPKMPTKLPKGEVFHEFHLLELSKINLDFFQQSDTPEVVAMGILSDFDGMPPEEVVPKLIDRIVEISPNESELHHHLKQFQIFSRIPKLSKMVTRKLKAMPITMNDFPTAEESFFNEGKEEGLEEGKWKTLVSLVKDGLLDV